MSSAILDPLAATKSSSFLRSSAAIQRAIWNSAGSKSTGKPYSSFSRTFSTSSCSGPTTPTRAGEPSSGRKTCTTPSSASSCSACLSFFAFIASISRRRRRISGAKFGTPMKVRSSPSVSVSPMRKVPWFGMPTTSPAKASSAMARSCAKKNTGELSVIGLPVRTCFTFIPRASLPEQSRAKAMRSRWFGSMLAWILKTKALMRGSSASTRRLRVAGDRIEQVLHPEILQRGAEEDRSQVAFAERGKIELAAGILHQRQLVGERGRIEIRIKRGDFRQRHVAQVAGLAVGIEQPNLSARNVEGADEVAALPDRPGDRRGVERQGLFDF